MVSPLLSLALILVVRSGLMPSSTQQADPYGVFANTLSSLTGLNVSVIDAWARAENGANNNILGVTSNGKLNIYPNQQAAAIDTAARLKSSSYYKGIMASTGGSPSQQALAIAQSPWRLGPTGLKNVGGTDPYYAKIFKSAGLLTGTGGITSVGSSITDPVTSAAGTALTGLAAAASTPFIFIGIVIIAGVFVLLGGLVMLKGNG